MPSIKDLRKRITTVKNTQQTTKAMKMVSAAKLRRAQDAIQAHRPFARRLGAMIQFVSSLPDVKVDSPLLGREALEGEGGRPKLLLVVVTSDRGLCGGFNGAVIKTAQRWVAANADRYSSVKLAFVGRKGNEYFKTRSIDRGPYWAELGGKVTFAKGKALANALTALYLEGEVDEVKVVYNEFKNAASQKPVVEHFMPVREIAAAAGDGAEAGIVETPPLTLVRPDPESLLRELLGRHFAVQAFRVLLESQAGEHGARMSAMENATKNAGEMIKKLTLQYNRQRQAGITKELLEIISGSESQKASAG